MKRVIALLLALLLTCSLAACAAKDVTQQIISENQAEETQQTAYPVTITDQAGRSVTIEDAPETLVSGYYISTSALMALGQKEKLVGIEAKADKRPIYAAAAPELIALPNVGSAKEFDLEGCAALEPDLVFLPVKLKEAAATLEELGMDVVLVNPENQALLEDMIHLMSLALDCREQEDALMGYLDGVKALLPQVNDGPTVYMAGNSSLLSTAPNGMYQSDLIALAGGTNAAAELSDTYWAEVSYEQVLSWDPCYIILASDASYTVEDVLADPALADCRAVKNGDVYRMPGDLEALDSPVPGGVLGALWLAGILHPDLVDTVEMNDRTVGFYQQFYGIRN